MSDPEMLLVALTGSIGMGKSTTAKMFSDAGIPVWDADAAVHDLYDAGGAGAARIAEMVPDAVTDQGVDRGKLRAAVLGDKSLLSKIESAIHPLVGQDRAAFLKKARDDGHPIAICDIPLLFETGGNRGFDRVVVVTAPADIQRTRVLERPGMTAEAFEAILAKQVPDAKKRAQADHIVDTSLGLDHARAQVADIIAQLKAEHA